MSVAADGLHFDEVVQTIAGVKLPLWRAIDRTGMVLDILGQGRPDTRAAKRLMRVLLNRQTRPPRVMVTVKLASFGATRREVLPSAGHRKHKGLNSRTENSHRPTCLETRQTKRFKSGGQV